MSAVRALRDIQELRNRSGEHGKLASVLFDTDQEWASVVAFYSAYQLVRASFIADPIFDDRSRLKRANPKLEPEDRWAEKHSKGGLSAVSYGVTEIVSVLYPNIKGRYGRLHIASCMVRYSDGLGSLRLSSIKDDWNFIMAEYDAGNIVSPV